MKNTIIGLLLCAPILCFATPLVFLGTENLEMISHLDSDEATIVEFAGEIYSKGFVAGTYKIAYPQFFYYLTGIVLFPYTFIQGLNYQVIVITLRLFNVLIVSLITLLLYFFVKKYFKSCSAAMIAAVLFSTTPEVLWWSVNCRPHLLSLFLVLITIYFCFKFIEEENVSIFKKAIVSASLSSATNFGGVFLIPSLWFSSLLHALNTPIEELVDRSKRKFRLLSAFALGLLLISAVAPFIAVFLYDKNQEAFSKIMGISSLEEFLRFRNFRLFTLVMAIVAFFSFLWLMLNFILKKTIAQNKNLQRSRNLFIANSAIVTLFLIIITMGIIFLIANPSYLRFPVATAKSIFFQFTLSSIGASRDARVYSGIFDKSFLIWLQRLFDNRLLNLWFGLLLVPYIFFELFSFKKNVSQEKKSLFQRVLLWIYATSLFLSLYLFCSRPVHHYLLPIYLTAILLISQGWAFIATKTNKKHALSLLFFAILLMGAYERSQEIRHSFTLLQQKQSCIVRK